VGSGRWVDGLGWWVLGVWKVWGGRWGEVRGEKSKKLKIVLTVFEISKNHVHFLLTIVPKKSDRLSSCILLGHQ
jgi:hypothetical protein